MDKLYKDLALAVEVAPLFVYNLDKIYNVSYDENGKAILVDFLLERALSEDTYLWDKLCP